MGGMEDRGRKNFVLAPRERKQIGKRTGRKKIWVLWTWRRGEKRIEMEMRKIFGMRTERKRKEEAERKTEMERQKKRKRERLGS